MTKANDPGRKRSIFSSTNKFQDKILLLTYLPTMLIFVVIISIVTIGNPIVSRSLFHASFPAIQRLIFQFSMLIEFGLCLVVIGAFMASFIISNRMVGAFDRLIREMDEIIAGKSVKTLKARPKDDLANELLKRVNVFIEGYLKSLKNKG